MCWANYSPGSDLLINAFVVEMIRKADRGFRVRRFEVSRPADRGTFSCTGFRSITAHEDYADSRPGFGDHRGSAGILVQSKANGVSRGKLAA